MLAYNSVISDDTPKEIVREITCYEFCVLRLLCSLSETVYGVLFRHWSDTQLRENVEILAPLAEDVRKFVDTFGFTTIIDGGVLEKTLVYLSYNRSEDIMWEELHFLSPFQN